MITFPDQGRLSDALQNSKKATAQSTISNVGGCTQHANIIMKMMMMIMMMMMMMMMIVIIIIIITTTTTTTI